MHIWWLQLVGRFSADFRFWFQLVGRFLPCHSCCFPCHSCCFRGHGGLHSRFVTCRSRSGGSLMSIRVVPTGGQVVIRVAIGVIVGSTVVVKRFALDGALLGVRWLICLVIGVIVRTPFVLGQRVLNFVAVSVGICDLCWHVLLRSDGIDSVQDLAWRRQRRPLVPDYALATG